MIYNKQYYLFIFSSNKPYRLGVIMSESESQIKKERVMVFIDGSNLYHVLNQHFSRNDIKFGKFAEKLAGDRELVRTYYYNIKQENISNSLGICDIPIKYSDKFEKFITAVGV